MKTTALNYSHNLRSTMLMYLSSFLAPIFLFFSIFNIFSEQAYVLGGLQFAYFLFSLYVAWQANQGRTQFTVSIVYIYILAFIVAFAVIVRSPTSAVSIWSCLFPVINYLLLGRRYGLTHTAIIFVIQAIALTLRLTIYNDDINHILLINISGLYIGLWSLSHIYEMRRKFSEQSLERLATHDSLTGMFNRYALLYHFEKQRAESNHTDTPLSVLILDLDYFKQVNDRYGHNAGDKVLIQTAQLLRKLLPNHHAYRIGGEEFCITLAHTNAEQALNIAELIREKIANHVFHASGYQIQLTTSIGLCQCGHDQNLEDVLIAADIELYRAKQSGRNRVMGL